MCQKERDILAPLRKPSREFSKAAFVIRRKADVIAPDAAKPAKKDCKRKRRWVHKNSQL